MPQAVEYLPRKHEALSSNSSTTANMYSGNNNNNINKDLAPAMSFVPSRCSVRAAEVTCEMV
jgi:hypothetical protein